MVCSMYDLFDAEAVANDPFPCFEKIFDTIKNDHVNTVVFHLSFELGLATLLQPDRGGFGRFSYLPTGERVFVRVRSFFGNSEVDGIALDPIRYGETREITVLVTSISSPLRSGSIKVIVATWNTQEAPDPVFAASARPPTCARAPSQAAYGSSVAPFVLLDRFVGKNKKTVSIGGYEAMWSGSTTLVEMWDSERQCAAQISVHRGISNHYLCEWVAGVEKRSKVDLSIIYECSTSGFEQIARRAVMKVQPAIDQRNAHRRPDEPVETLSGFSDAMRLSNFFLEHGTLAAMVDLLARDVFRGVPVSVFHTPTKFPLYVTVCVLLAAFPEMARLPSGTDASHEEDWANASVIIEHFRSLTSGHDLASGQRTTAIEAILAVCCDGVGCVVTKRATKTADGRLKSVYVRSTGDAITEEVSHIPYAIENMRRQGAALLQELFGDFPAELQRFNLMHKLKPGIGKDVLDTATSDTLDRVTRFAHAAQRQRGATGSVSHATARAVRHSTRDAMQRVVLEMMLEVNQFVTDGTFRMVRYTPANTMTEEASHGPSSGIQRNAGACQAAHDEILNFFTSGVSALILSGMPRLFCIRPRTRVKCGDCGEQFNPLKLIPRDNLSLCEDCNVLFCLTCYQTRVQNLKTANGGEALTLQSMYDHPELLRCVRCVGCARTNRV